MLLHSFYRNKTGMSKFVICKTSKSKNPLFATRLVLFFIFLLMAVSCGRAAESTIRDKVTAYFFYAHGCSSCESAELFMNNLYNSNPRVEIKKIEVFLDMNNFKLYQTFLERAGLEPKGMPLILVGDHQWAGFEPTDQAEVVEAIGSCLQNGCVDKYQDLFDSLSFSESGKK